MNRLLIIAVVTSILVTVVVLTDPNEAPVYCFPDVNTPAEYYVC